MNYLRFDGILSKDGTTESEHAACVRIAENLLNVQMSKKEVLVFGIENMQQEDLAAAEKHGRVCHLVSRGCKNKEGTTAYTEPCFLCTDDPLAKLERGLIVTEADGIPQDRTTLLDMMTSESTQREIVENDNSIEVHPYYIRTKYSKGLWLDVVTVEKWENGVLTMPVSVKAMHNWAEHAIKKDPELFFAAVM